MTLKRIIDPSKKGKNILVLGEWIQIGFGSSLCCNQGVSQSGKGASEGADGDTVLHLIMGTRVEEEQCAQQPEE